MYALSLMPDDVNKFGSRSRLVIIAAQRAQQLMKGIPSTIVTKHTKPTTIALEEVLKNAPQTDGPFFKVPKIIGGDEDSAA